jgi:PadR family transcriptional regulator PadR
MAVSKVDLVVLACLSERPLHGYDLLEHIKARGIARWADVGRASVYQSLQRLDRQGLIVGRDQEGTAGPDRRVFRITRGGRERLRTGLLDRLAVAGPYETGAGPALGFVHLLAPADARRALEAHQRALHELIDTLRRDRDGAESRDAGARAMLDRQIALADAESEWAARFRAAFSEPRRKPTVG